MSVLSDRLKTKLESRAKTALFNTKEITPEVIEGAIFEALDLVNEKPIGDTLLLDLAYVRLKLRLKIDIEQLEEKLAMMAIKEADKVALVTNESGEASVILSSVKSGKRVSEWDL